MSDDPGIGDDFWRRLHKEQMQDAFKRACESHVRRMLSRDRMHSAMGRSDYAWQHHKLKASELQRKVELEEAKKEAERFDPDAPGNEKKRICLECGLVRAYAQVCKWCGFQPKMKKKKADGGGLVDQCPDCKKGLKAGEKCFCKAMDSIRDMLR